LKDYFHNRIHIPNFTFYFQIQIENLKPLKTYSKPNKQEKESIK